MRRRSLEVGFRERYDRSTIRRQPRVPEHGGVGSKITSRAVNGGFAGAYPNIWRNNSQSYAQALVAGVAFGPNFLIQGLVGFDEKC